MPSEKALNRKITTELNKIQSQLSKALEKFYKSKVVGTTMSLEQVRSKYQTEIKNLIRKLLEQSWLYSHVILNDVTKQQINISVNDIQGIEQATDKVENQFWSDVNKLYFRNEVESFKVNTTSELEELDSFDVHAQFIGFGLFGIYFAFNTGMESKASELTTRIRLKFVTREDCIDSTLCIPLRGVYEIGLAPSLPIHKHCRCKLIPVVE